MNIILADDNNRTEWDRFVNTSEESSIFHLYDWRRIFEGNYNFKTFYLMTKDDSGIRGILPLIRLGSRITGRFFVSLPVSDDGGLCGRDRMAHDLLIQRSVEIAAREKADYIEFRHRQKREGMETKESKVSMWLKLDPDHQKMWNAFNNKVRNQIRKASKCGLKIRMGGMEEIDRFYRVYAINMRDIGMPAHGKRFFVDIVRRFPDKIKIFSVVNGNGPAASGFTFGFKHRLEIPWASSIRKYNSLCPNHLLYWEIVKHACGHGYGSFGFGRSVRGSGTFKFKRQWGAEPRQLYWQYCIINGNELPQVNPQNSRYAMAIKLWQKTPVFMTKLIGPIFMRLLPY